MFTPSLVPVLVRIDPKCLVLFFKIAMSGAQGALYITIQPNWLHLTLIQYGLVASTFDSQLFLK